MKATAALLVFVKTPVTRHRNCLTNNRICLGKKVSTLRTQVGKCASRWIGYHKQGIYAERVLSQYQFKASSFRTEDNPLMKGKKKGLKPEDISDVSSEDSTAQSKSSKKSKDSKKSKTKSRPPEEVVVGEKTNPQEPRFRKKVTSSAAVQTHSFKFKSKTKGESKMSTSGMTTFGLVFSSCSFC